MGITEEASFPDTADNLENKTVALGKWVFNLGGVVHEFKDVLRRFQESMKHWTDRGPEDYDKNERDLRDLLTSAVREGSRRANIEIHGYTEGGGGSWKDKAIWVMMTLLVSGIIGNVVQYAEIASLKTAFQDFTTSMERRVNNLEQRIYRGTP